MVTSFLAVPFIVSPQMPKTVELLPAGKDQSKMSILGYLEFSFKCTCVMQNLQPPKD